MDKSLPNSIALPPNSPSGDAPGIRPVTVETENVDLTILLRTRLDHLCRRVRDAVRETGSEHLAQMVTVPLREAEHTLDMSTSLRRGMRDTTVVDRLTASA